MESKTKFIEEKLKQVKVENYSEQDFRFIKQRFIEELFIYKDKEKAFQEAFKTWKQIFRGERQ